MAEIDEFVIKYTVELGATIERLNKVKKAMEDLGSTSSKSTTGFNDIVSQALRAKKHFHGLTGGIEGALRVLTKLPGPLKVAAVLLVGVAEAIKLVNASLREYNQQRQVAIAAGMGYLGVENFQRNMISASGGFVGAAESQGILRNISNMGLQAYQDPYQWNRQARILQMAGASVTGPGGGIADVNQQIGQIADRFKSMTEVEARAMGQLLGISQNAADAMHQLGSAIVSTTKMTDDEAVRHKEATQASIRLQAAYNSLDESGRRMRDMIADELMPVYEKLIEMFSKVAEIVVKFTDNVLDLFSGIGRFVDTLMTDLKLKMEGSGQSIKDILEDASKAYERPPETAAAITAAEGEENRQQRQLYAQWSRDINLFSQAVGQFSGIIDDKQAWAAWAGTVGAAGGLGTAAGAERLRPGEPPVGAALTVNTAAYGEAVGGPGTGLGTPISPGGGGGGGGIAAPTAEDRANVAKWSKILDLSGLEKQHGLPAGMLSAVMMAESRGNITAVSRKGAAGLFQFMPDTAKEYHVDPMDPIPSAEAAAKKLEGLYKKYNGNVQMTLAAYNFGEGNLAKFGMGGLPTETRNYVPFVLSQMGAGAGGSSIAGGKGWTGAITGAPAGLGDGGAPMTGDNTQSPAMAGMGMGSAAIKYAYDRTAKPIIDITGPDMIPMRTVDDKPTGYLPQNPQRKAVAQMLSPYLRNIPVDTIMRGSHVSREDIKIAESQVASDIIKQEQAGLAKWNAIANQTGPMADVKRGQVLAELRDAETKMTNLMRYGPQLARGGAASDERVLTYGQMPVQINISGAMDPKLIANEIHKILTGHYADVENGATTKMKK